MNRYIGMDAHDKSCTLVVEDEKGVEVKRALLETNGAQIVDFIRQVPKPRHLGLEEGNLSQWLYELLEPECQEVMVFVPPKHTGPKDDYRDARRAAEVVRTHSVEQVVYKPDRDLADLQTAVRAYQVERKDLTRAMLRLKAVFRSRAVFAGDEIYDPEERKKELEKLPKFERRLAELFGRQVDMQTELLKEAANQLRRSAGHNPAVQLIATVPQLGVVRSATIAAVVGTPHRFRTREQFRSYCGLGIVRRSSSDYQKQGGRWMKVKKDCTRGLNRNRNGWLKDCFKGAATALVCREPEHPLAKLHTSRVQNGVDPRLSQLTVARQLADTVLAMWKKKEEYDPSRHAGSKDKLTAK